MDEINLVKSAVKTASEKFAENLKIFSPAQGNNGYNEANYVHYLAYEL